MRPPSSFLSRLVGAQVLTLVAFWTVLLGAVAFGALRYGHGDFDRELMFMARAFLRLTAEEPDPARIAATGAGLDGISRDLTGGEACARFQVREASGRLLYASPGAPREPFSPVRDGFSTVSMGGTSWRVASAGRGPLIVQAAESVASRQRALWIHLRAFFLQASLVLPFGLLFTWWAARGGLRPLHDLAAAVSRRSPKDLRPVQAGTDLKETRPLVEAMNHLLARLKGALEAQRRFLGDAAHELRTPLAAVEVQAHVLARAEDPGSRNAALADLEAGLERASGLVAQLLAVARLEAEDFTPRLRDVDLDAEVRTWLSALAGPALDRGLELGLESPGPLQVRTDPEWLRRAFDNLLENALRHGHPDGRVEVALRATPEGVTLRVADDGPGIPEEARERVFERFYRLPGCRAPGCGLGLPIVRSALAALGGTVRLETGLEGRGLAVVLCLPA